MADLMWHDFLKIGVDFIDDDHRKLLEIMQDTKQAIEEDNQNACIISLTALLKEAREHFAREETFLEKTKFPGLEEHKIYHRELLIKADTTKRVCEGIDTEHGLQECFDGMASFLIDDILRGDIKFKSHLQYHGYIDENNAFT
jgi:hemerythrin-like metal-binding protein